ncbi:hypothetical protein pb186bvf_018155 [Paramecium bursaria]
MIFQKSFLYRKIEGSNTRGKTKIFQSFDKSIIQLALQNHNFNSLGLALILYTIWLKKIQNEFFDFLFDNYQCHTISRILNKQIISKLFKKPKPDQIFAQIQQFLYLLSVQSVIIIFTIIPQIYPSPKLIIHALFHRSKKQWFRYLPQISKLTVILWIKIDVSCKKSKKNIGIRETYNELIQHTLQISQIMIILQYIYEIFSPQNLINYFGSMNWGSCLHQFPTPDQVLENDTFTENTLIFQVKREQFREKLRNQQVKEWFHKQRQIARGWLQIKLTEIDHFRQILQQSSNSHDLKQIIKIYDQEQDSYCKKQFQDILQNHIIKRDGVPFAILSGLVSFMGRSQIVDMPYEAKLAFFKSLFDIFEERKHLFLYTGYLKLINDMLFEDPRLVNEMRQQSDQFVKLLGPNLEYYSLNELTEVGNFVGMIMRDELQYQILDQDQDAQIRRLFTNVCKMITGPNTFTQAKNIMNFIFILRLLRDNGQIVNQFRIQIVQAYEILEQLDHYHPTVLFSALLFCVTISQGSSKEVLVDCLMEWVQKMSIGDQFFCLKQYIISNREAQLQVYDTLYSFELSPSYWKSVYYIFRFIEGNHPFEFLLDLIRMFRIYIDIGPQQNMIEFNRVKIERAKLILRDFSQIVKIIF